MFSILTLSENSSQKGSEICFLSDQSWIIMKDIWSSYMHIYWLYYDYIVYNTLFTLLQCSAVNHSLTAASDTVKAEKAEKVVIKTVCSWKLTEAASAADEEVKFSWIAAVKAAAELIYLINISVYFIQPSIMFCSWPFTMFNLTETWWS